MLLKLPVTVYQVMTLTWKNILLTLNYHQHDIINNGNKEVDIQINNLPSGFNDVNDLSNRVTGANHSVPGRPTSGKSSV